MQVIVIIGVFGLLFTIALFIGVQVLASIKGSRYTGLIIPAIHLLGSVVVLYLAPFYIQMQLEFIIGIVALLMLVVYLGIFLAGYSKKKQLRAYEQENK